MMSGANAAFDWELGSSLVTEVSSASGKLDKSSGSSVENKEKTSVYPRAVPKTVIDGVADERLHPMDDDPSIVPSMNTHFEVAVTPKQIGKRLAVARKAANMTQQEVADQMQSHKEFVGRLERGQTNPTFETVMSYARVVGLSGGFTFFDKEPT